MGDLGLVRFSADLWLITCKLLQILLAYFTNRHKYQFPKRIDNCLKSNDVQTAVMIIAKLKQYDKNIGLVDTESEHMNKDEQIDVDLNKHQKNFEYNLNYIILTF